MAHQSAKISVEVQKTIALWGENLAHIRKYSTHTIRAYITDLFYFLNFLSNYYEEEITLNNLNKVNVTDLRSWLANKTIHNIKSKSKARALSVIKNFYRYLQENHNIKCDALEIIKIKKTESSLPKVMSTEQIQNIITTMDSYSEKSWINARDIAVLYLLYGCGLRISEALNLKIKDIANGEVKIFGKGRKERVMPLLKIVEEKIQKYIELCPFNCNELFLFLGAKGKAYNPDVFRRNLRKIRGLLGLPEHATPHSFRHSFATHLLSENSDLRIIQEMLGHENLSTTQIYTKVNLNKMVENFKKFHPLEKASESE